ncbi:MAG TPA: phosphotransferase [Candidatus Saccharimonadales bacterium]|nr:phosphotransferase [Candidatus Saccharimonadales bacterium]
MDIQQLNDFFHEYADEQLIESRRNGSAFANDAYNLKAADGQRYVMRILKQQLVETVQHEADLQAKLAAAGISTPQYLKFRSGSYVGEYDEHRFTISKHIDGETPKSMPLRLVRSFGETLAKIHSCLSNSDVPPSKMQWLDPRNAEDDMAAYDGELKPRLAPLIAKYKEFFGLDMPKCLIHGDLWLGNVFAEGDQVTAVFDLETAEYTYRILDLARTYLSARRETELDPQQLVDTLFEGYESIAATPLTTEERASFATAYQYVAGVDALWNALHDGVGRGAEVYIALGENPGI